MDNKTQSNLINEFAEILTLATKFLDALDRNSEIEIEGFTADTKEVDELFDKIAEARKELAKWLTNLSLTTLAFFLTILIQINLRDKVDFLDRFTVLISLSSLSLSSIIGLIDKFLSIFIEIVESLLKIPETILSIPVRGSQQFGILEPEEEEKKVLAKKIREFRIRFSKHIPLVGLLIGKKRYFYPFYQLILFLVGLSSLTVCITIFVFSLSEKPLGEVLRLLLIFIVIVFVYPWLSFIFKWIFRLMQKNIKPEEVTHS